ncbi:acyltransferase family protein, partial [Geminicoccus harenae]
MRYRSDIDGLRALAIVPVLAFHAGVDLFQGGFVGVDVFFVISGYLITSIVMTELAEGRFSIAEFYKRRILRIVPALTVVLLATAAVACIVMLPNEFRETGRSVVAASLFVSNVFFWQTSGYFDGPADQKPLLHTWSLAIEEQFYLFFPILLLVLHRWLRGHLAVTVAVLVALSFLLGVLRLPAAPSTTFYLLPTRAWELGIGALLAICPLPRLGQRTRETGAVLGLLLLLYAVFGLSPADPFPGWNALWPCLGAALIIACAEATRTGQLLGTRPFVAIGAISYSLYLWHWPLIVFYRLLHGQELTPVESAGLIAASLLLATLSYRFVETPFRTPALRRTRSGPVLASCAAVIAASVALGASVDRFGASWRQYPAEVVRIAHYADYHALPDYRYQFRPGQCLIGAQLDADLPFRPEQCLEPDPARPDYLVVGDSHAAHLWRGLSLTFPDIHFLQATATGCRPLHGGPGEARCTELIRQVFDDFLPKTRLDGIILAGRWRSADLPRIEATIAHLAR